VWFESALVFVPPFLFSFVTAFCLSYFFAGGDPPQAANFPSCFACPPFFLFFPFFLNASHTEAFVEIPFFSGNLGPSDQGQCNICFPAMCLFSDSSLRLRELLPFFFFFPTRGGPCRFFRPVVPHIPGLVRFFVPWMDRRLFAWYGPFLPTPGWGNVRGRPFSEFSFFPPFGRNLLRFFRDAFLSSFFAFFFLPR